jgi:ArsR family transcriptional regulator, lead/cadmium/zinc/bismuth-responsive transcriptional repressor
MAMEPMSRVCDDPTLPEDRMKELREILLTKDNLVHLASLLSLVGNDTRIKLLYLMTCEKELCVCDLASMLDMTVSAVSQHLRKLKDKNIVKARRNAQAVLYSLNKTTFTDYVQHLLDGGYGAGH